VTCVIRFFHVERALSPALMRVYMRACVNFLWSSYTDAWHLKWMPASGCSEFNFHYDSRQSCLFILQFTNQIFRRHLTRPGL